MEHYREVKERGGTNALLIAADKPVANACAESPQHWAGLGVPEYAVEDPAEPAFGWDGHRLSSSWCMELRGGSSVAIGPRKLELD